MADNCQEEEVKPVGLEMSRHSGGSPCTHTSKRYKQQGQHQHQSGMGEGGKRNKGGPAWPQTNHKSGENRGRSFAPRRQHADKNKGYAHKPLVTRKMLENPWAELEQRCRS